MRLPKHPPVHQYLICSEVPNDKPFPWLTYQLELDPVASKGIISFKKVMSFVCNCYYVVNGNLSADHILQRL